MTIFNGSDIGISMLDGPNVGHHLLGMNVEKPSISVIERRIGFFVFPAFQILDLTGPLAAFEVAARLVPNTYRLDVLSKTGGQVASSAGVAVATTKPGGDPLDTLVVVGGAEVPSDHVAEIDAIRTLAATARRVTSVCTGAFLLAAAGMMGGRRATTHWRYTALLQRTYPEMKVESDRIFVRDGTVWTSADISAGIDLAFALIEDDLGVVVMMAVAREMVIPYRRSGGQSQFSEMLALEPATDRIRATLSYARANLTQSLTVERLAEIACLSPRQFARTFRSETGETPARAIERLRAEAAKPRVESGSEPIEVVAVSVGFTDPERMRRAFVRRFGHPPQSVRRMARGSGSAATTFAEDIVAE